MQELITTILHYNIVQNNAANCRSQTNILIASSATTTNCKHHFHDWSTATSHSPLMPLVRVWNSRSLKVVYNCIVCHYGWSMTVKPVLCYDTANWRLKSGNSILPEDWVYWHAINKRMLIDHETMQKITVSSRFWRLFRLNLILNQH